MNNIITIDGTSGSGKTTVAKIICDKLQYNLLDSGAHYRAIAYVSKKYKLNLATITKTADRFRILADAIYFDEELLNIYIYTEEVAKQASKIAVNENIRSLAATLHKKSNFIPGLVATGRDMGSVVFKDAKYKFFLKIQPDQASKRRFEQLKKNNRNANLNQIKSMIIERDKRDSLRESAPLTVPDGAFVIDTSDISAKEVSDSIINIINNLNRDKQQ
jgi:cytidylate kinase